MMIQNEHAGTKEDSDVSKCLDLALLIIFYKLKYIVVVLQEEMIFKSSIS